MKVKFGNTTYDIDGMNVNVSVTHFQVNVIKGNATIDKIIDDALSSDMIIVLNDDGERTGVYNGYTKLVAATAYDMKVVSIELENPDVRSQIESLAAAQADTAERLNVVEGTTDDLQSSQATQDLAIEDLAQAVSDMAPEEV